MADNKSTVSSGGIGFTGLLTIVFIVLKLCGIITWNWWWVISPVWISVSLVIVLLIVVATLGAWASKRWKEFGIPLVHSFHIEGYVRDKS